MKPGPLGSSVLETERDNNINLFKKEKGRDKRENTAVFYSANKKLNEDAKKACKEEIERLTIYSLTDSYPRAISPSFP